MLDGTSGTDLVLCKGAYISRFVVNKPSRG